MSEKHQDRETEENRTTREALRDRSNSQNTSENYGGVTPIDEAVQDTGAGQRRPGSSGLTTKNSVAGSDSDGQAV